MVDKSGIYHLNQVNKVNIKNNGTKSMSNASWHNALRRTLHHSYQKMHSMKKHQENPNWEKLLKKKKKKEEKNYSVFLKIIWDRKDKERLKTCSRWKATKETWQLKAIVTLEWFPNQKEEKKYQEYYRANGQSLNGSMDYVVAISMLISWCRWLHVTM